MCACVCASACVHGSDRLSATLFFFLWCLSGLSVCLSMYLASAISRESRRCPKSDFFSFSINYSIYVMALTSLMEEADYCVGF